MENNKDNVCCILKDDDEAEIVCIDSSLGRDRLMNAMLQ